MNSRQNKFALNTATVELTEFGDFMCFQSRSIRKLMDAVADSFGEQLIYRYRYLPDPDNTQSLLAALALEAARRQDQFGPMFSAMLTQPSVSCFTIVDQAKTLKLDTHQFRQDLLADRVHNVLKEDCQLSCALGVRNAPAIFVNGHRFYGKFTLSRLIPFVRFHITRSGAPASLPSLFPEWAG